MGLAGGKLRPSDPPALRQGQDDNQCDSGVLLLVVLASCDSFTQKARRPYAYAELPSH
jgi:hypothetical protein